MPLEIKSGRMYYTQEIQVLLYTLLLSDRYNIDVQGGLLYSLADQQMKEVTINRSTLGPLRACFPCDPTLSPTRNAQPLLLYPLTLTLSHCS